MFYVLLSWHQLQNGPGNQGLHYNDVIMSAMASQITILTIVYSNRLFRRRSKKNTKAPRRWPLWGEFTGPRTKDQ